MSQQTFTPSPCIRKCGLDKYEICRGCFRSIDEIMDWDTMPEPERQMTLMRCQQRRQEKFNRR